MTITHHPNVEQGSDEWLQLRCGLLTASEMKLILTPSLKVASNEKERAHLYELLAQRISGYVEPTYVGNEMLRGEADEIEARLIYEKAYGPVTETGFITNDKWGFTIGYSPDGLVGDDGLFECKSRRQKFQIQTVIENVMTDTAPMDFMFQCQTGLMVSERQWIDFVSYSGGLPMATIRVWPDPVIQEAIEAAATDFEVRLQNKLNLYREALASNARLIPTERIVIQEMYA